MKKKNLLALALSLILLVSYAAIPASNRCASDEDCPAGMRCLLHPDGFLICRVPSHDETMPPEETGNPQTYSACLSAGGNWNMASVCNNAGFAYQVPCTIPGEINAFGITLKGSYTKGHTYTVPWASYTCVISNGNCCVKQGLYSGGTKLD